jgi:hypothetical protein
MRATGYGQKLRCLPFRRQKIAVYVLEVSKMERLILTVARSLWPVAALVPLARHLLTSDQDNFLTM